MDKLLYLFFRAVVALLQALPLRWVARLGRLGGALAYVLDARHRRIALGNLRDCFAQERTETEIRSLAREHFRRLGENYACAIKTASMSKEELAPHIDWAHHDRILPKTTGSEPTRRVVAIGHFGNFELYARWGQFYPQFQGATTYRGLRQPSLSRLMQQLRERSGCWFFERRTDASKLKAAMNQPNILLGLLADQHAGDGGLWLEFFGRPCSTSAAPAIFAQRYHCPLHTGFCFRTGLAQWRIEAGAEIATQEPNGEWRSKEAIMRDVNRAFEEAIRRDPANWFWVHKRWKPRPAPRSAPPRSSMPSPEQESASES
jgi:lauroyl/myristoyl acyltransferase